MQEICAVIAAGGLGTRLLNYKNNSSTKSIDRYWEKLNDLHTDKSNTQLGYK